MCTFNDQLVGLNLSKDYLLSKTLLGKHITGFAIESSKEQVQVASSKSRSSRSQLFFIEQLW